MAMTLKALRANKNMTQKQAAELIGVSEDTWGNYERGYSFPDVPKIILIEKAFGVHYNEIIFLPTDNGLTVKKNRKDE